MHIRYEKIIVYFLLFWASVSFGMDIQDTHPYTQKRLRKKKELKNIIAERLAAVQSESKDKSYLDEPVKPGTHFYKTLLTKAVRHSLDADTIACDDDSLEDEIGQLLEAGANPLYQNMGGPLGEATNIKMAQLLLRYSDSPEKYKIAFSAFMTVSFDKWQPEERSEYFAWLLEQGVDPNEETIQYTNILHTRLPLLQLAGKIHYSSKKIYDDIALCIQKGADPNKKDTWTNRSVYEMFKIENPQLIKFMQEERVKYEQTL